MLRLRPTTIKQANLTVLELHRHHKPVRGALFALSCYDDDRLAGVVIVGRPVARMLDDGRSVEIVRVATDGTPNACSFLYGAAWRVARAMGYTRALTYTLPSEGGASLRASGWREVGSAGGGEWSRPSRVRESSENTEKKTRWEVLSNEYPTTL